MQAMKWLSIFGLLVITLWGLTACSCEDVRDLHHWDAVDDIEEEGIWLIYVFSANCGICAQIAPNIEAFAEDFEEQFPMYFADVTHGFDGTAPGPGVQYVPTMIVMEGQTFLEQRIGPSEIYDLFTALTEGTYAPPE